MCECVFHLNNLMQMFLYFAYFRMRTEVSISIIYLKPLWRHCDLFCLYVPVPVQHLLVKCLVSAAVQLRSKINISTFFFQLRSGGSQILEGCIAEIPNISSLDISDNGEMAVNHAYWNLYLLSLKPYKHYNYYYFLPGLDSDLSTLLIWLAKNRSIRHLSLGKNFNNIKSK